MTTWRNYKVKLRFTSPLLGSTPLDPKALLFVKEREAAEHNVGEEGWGNVEPMEKVSTGFYKDDTGIYIMDYQVRGFFKAASIALAHIFPVRKTGKRQGEAPAKQAIKGWVDNYLFVTPRNIYLGKDKEDDVLIRPLRAETMQGPRIALTASQQVNAGTEIDFSLDTTGDYFTADVLKELLDYGRRKGLGQWNSGGFGTFEVVEFIETN